MGHSPMSELGGTNKRIFGQGESRWTQKVQRKKKEVLARSTMKDSWRRIVWVKTIQDVSISLICLDRDSSCAPQRSIPADPAPVETSGALRTVAQRLLASWRGGRRGGRGAVVVVAWKPSP